MTEQKPNSYSKLEWEAFLDVPALQGIEYKLPYSLEHVTRDDMQNGYKWKVWRIGWEDGTHYMEWEEIPVTGAFRVLFNAEPSRYDRKKKLIKSFITDSAVPMSDFYLKKEDARKCMEMYNIRHFKVIKMSSNQLAPVLI